MRTIIAATDFSAVSLNAVRYAADIACIMGADLTLFHVYELPTPVSEVPVPAFNVEALEQDAQKQIEQLKAKMIDRTEGRIAVHTDVRPGNVIAELIDYCTKSDPWAVVVGAETTGSFESLLFGAKTVSAMRRLEFPLLIVPPMITFKNIRNIGLACDLRDVVDSVRVQEIQVLVNEFHARLHVMHVSDEKGGGFSPATVEESGLLQEMLEPLKPVYHFINDQEVEKGIIACAEQEHLDLLVIIPKRHDLVHKIFQHSYSKNIVLHAHVPVLSIHE